MITTALTQIALAGGAWVSYAGVFNLVHHRRVTQDSVAQTDSLSACFATFAEENDPASIPPAPQRNGRTGGKSPDTCL